MGIPSSLCRRQRCTHEALLTRPAHAANHLWRFELSHRPSSSFLISSPNGSRYLLAGGVWTRLESRIPLGRRKCLKMPRNPASQVHAVLGGVSIFNFLLNFIKLFSNFCFEFQQNVAQYKVVNRWLYGKKCNSDQP